ncbi:MULTISPECIES: hypothetical protein [Actinosynnema]|uniref:Uncharacterized protein n=2 Tax=Actinosynnema TaxID=40566 RepID=A0A290Z216_9PSEU|nr:MULTISPECIES: hypothetical protein [Actinosynnema]ACU35377.1 putative integral membrane protein [Actinosynnema mirum DSM 43827]ATE53076.1 hypothetical protein CNX65_07070 [Actinosynnema pretiosum]
MRARIEQRTLRTDRWWLPPLATAAALLLISAYAAVRTFMGDYYWVDDYHYLTPMYSPCLSQECLPEAAHFGRPLPELPGFLTPPVVILPFLLGFRVTCYYYRKAYYRAAWLSPPACAVAEPHARYTGETRFPLIAQNLHRYFFLAASVLLLVNTYDALAALTTGLGLGNIILLVNVTLLGAYTLSCHSCRHIAGGRLKHFSRHPVRYRMWTLVSRLNARHMLLAWASLVFVCLTDLYIALVSAGVVSDLRFIG